MKHNAGWYSALLLSALGPFLLWACVLALGFVPTLAGAATVVVVNKDDPGEGFNDTTPVAPVGGNTATTLGAQRLAAFQYAANIWGGLIASAVPIRVGAQFDPLSCSSTTAVVGSAGPSASYRDFAGAPLASTWYPVALANALRGTDLDATVDDISATFNSAIGTTCAFPSVWYYGLDASPPSNQIDFVSVLLHELGHGLGFLTLVDLTTGAKALGFNDTYMRHLEDHSATPSDYPSMSNAQRVAASTNTGNLHWTGARLKAASSVLSAGLVGDHVRMYAPNPQKSGSSVSHFDTALTPNQIMEPSYTGPIHTPVLELPLFQDIGWTLSSGGPSSQTVGAISFNPTSLAFGGTTTASATASSGLGVTFSSLTTSTCTVSASTVTAISLGNCTVAANQTGNASFLPAPQVTRDITVGKASQTIGAVSFMPTGLSLGDFVTANATASSGLSVDFSSTTPGVCTVIGNTVTGNAVGNCIIAANQSGNINYLAAPQVTQSIAVSQTGQTIGPISFNPLVLSVGTTTVASATSTSGLAVSFGSTTPGFCTVSGSTVSGINAGTCTVAANQSGTTNLAAAPQVTQNITVGKGTQNIIFGAAPTLVVGATATVSATGGASGSPVTFTSTTSGVCSVSGSNGSTITAITAGTCTVAANQAGNANYNAAPQVTASIVITAASQAITGFNPTSPVVFGASPAPLIATGGASGNAVVFATTSANTVCTVNNTNSTVTFTGVGTCNLTANQAGNANFNAAPQVTASIVITAASQAITGFNPASPVVFGASPATLSATGGASGSPVVFATTSASTVCTVAGSTVTFTGVGICNLTANQAGNTNFNAAPQVTQTITVSAPTTRLINISTRGQVLSGDNVMIGGFIIQGASPKTVLIRAVGPTLANFGVRDVLSDPALQLFSGQTQIASNDDWQTASNAAAIQATTLAPSNTKESAILTTLAPGAYTAIVSGVGGATGVGIVEVYDIDHPEVPLINISTRGQVQTGDNVMIGGFIIQGTSPQTVLIRAVGPNLANFGVSDVLDDPKLELYSGQSVIASNDNWQTATNAAAIQATTLAPADPREAAILITLQPGAYTAVVSGANGGVGVGIIEVFAR